MSVAPLTTAVMGTAGRAQAGVASAVNDAVSWRRSTRTTCTSRAIELPPTLDAAAAETVGAAVREAFVCGFRAVMWTASALAPSSVVGGGVMMREDTARSAE